MKSDNLIYILKSKNVPVFTDADVSKITGKSRAYAHLKLSRILNAGLIKRVERGKYYFPETNIYAIASNIIYPSYISLSAAFRFHDITTQTLTSIDIITTKRHKIISDLEEHRINFINIGKSRLFGYYRDKRNGVFVASIEKAVLDALYFNNPPIAYVEDALDTANNENKLDFEKLISFAAKMHSGAVLRKLSGLIDTLGLGIKGVVIGEHDDGL